jgi:hypothetical protein
MHTFFDGFVAGSFSVAGDNEIVHLIVVTPDASFRWSPEAPNQEQLCVSVALRLCVKTRNR